MDNLKLGQLITEPQQRDAVHVAVVPVRAAGQLAPGQHVGFVTSSQEIVGANGTHIGIIDPFLSAPVSKDEQCWMFLYPGSITSLRHDWTHPAFMSTPVVDKASSQAWMEAFAAKHYSHLSDHYHGTGRNYTADEVVEFAKDFLLYGDKHVQQGSESLRDTTIPEEFWPHFEAITGMKVADYHRHEVPFCCTC